MIGAGIPFVNRKIGISAISGKNAPWLAVVGAAHVPHCGRKQKERSSALFELPAAGAGVTWRR
jgi:hypothetical protein